MSEALARSLGCELTQLRLSDSFCGNLAIRPDRWLPLDGDDADLEILDEEILRKLLPASAWAASGKESGSIRSLGDLIQWYDRTVLKKGLASQRSTWVQNADRATSHA
jgi:hypothetical protein